MGSLKNDNGQGESAIVKGWPAFFTHLLKLDGEYRRFVGNAG